MKRTCMLFFTLLLGVSVSAQMIEVAAGDTLNKVVGKNLQYAFEDFTDGTVFFKTGEVGRAKLNYNYLQEEIQFINPSTNEILTLDGINKVASIVINKREFVPSGPRSGFIELLVKGNVNLAVERKVKTLSMGKTGAYGGVSSTSSIESYSSIYSGTQAHSLSVKDNINLVSDALYYLYHSNGSKVLIKGEKTFLKVYPNNKSELISEYVKDNKVNFKKEDDLIKLTEYCNQL